MQKKDGEMIVGSWDSPTALVQSPLQLPTASVWSLHGQMDCDLTPFPMVFQSYQDNGQMVMKGCMQWNPVYN